MSTLTTPPIGEVVAESIAKRMDALGWEFDHLADESGIDWHRLISHRADAGGYTMSELFVIATALDVTPADLVRREGA